MNKYWALIKVSWQNGLVYRANIVLWRFRQVLTSLMALTVWTVIFTTETSVLSYTQSEMISYIFITAILHSLILATSLHGLAGRLYGGQITYELLKPVNLYAILFSEDIADKLKNFGFIVLETLALYLIFQPLFNFPTLPLLLVAVFWIMLAVILHFFITLLFGSLGFWTPDVWGPKFIYFIMLDFTAGRLYPIDILPQFIQTILQYTPFPYLTYYQTQLITNRLASDAILQHSLVLIFWCIFFGLLVKFTWHKGLKSYEAIGR